MNSPLGEICACDPLHDRDYVFTFRLRNSHISEGLYERSVALDVAA